VVVRRNADHYTEPLSVIGVPVVSAWTLGTLVRPVAVGVVSALLVVVILWSITPWRATVRERELVLAYLPFGIKRLVVPRHVVVIHPGMMSIGFELTDGRRRLLLPRCWMQTGLAFIFGNPLIERARELGYTIE
jgi:hypothetical protein